MDVVARPRNEQRSAEQRKRILRAAAAEFAAAGFTKATTMAIHRRADLSSGTLFHYFPTKLDLLLGILEAGTAETAQTLRALDETTAGRDAVLAYAAHLESEIADTVYAGLVHAVGDVERVPAVRDALDAETALVDAFLQRHLAEELGGHDSRAWISSQARSLRWLMDGASAAAVTAPLEAGSLVAAVSTLLDGIARHGGTDRTTTTNT